MIETKELTKIPTDQLLEIWNNTDNELFCEKLKAEILKRQKAFENKQNEEIQTAN